MVMDSKHKAQMWTWIAFWIMVGLILINVHWANTLTTAEIKTEHKFTIEADDEVVQIMQMAYNISSDEIEFIELDKVPKIHYSYDCSGKYTYRYHNCEGQALLNASGKYCDKIQVCQSQYVTRYE